MSSVFKCVQKNEAYPCFHKPAGGPDRSPEDWAQSWYDEVYDFNPTHVVDSSRMLAYETYSPGLVPRANYQSQTNNKNYFPRKNKIYL